MGFVSETYDPIIAGVTEAIARAHNSMVSGRAFYSEIPMKDFGVNRSPASYLANPAAERELYEENVDRNLQQIRFVNAQNEVVGAFHWVASNKSLNNYKATTTTFIGITFSQLMPYP